MSFSVTITPVMARLEPTLSGALTGLNSKGRLTALLTNIITGVKKMIARNTLAYYATELITSVKSFIMDVQEPVL